MRLVRAQLAKHRRWFAGVIVFQLVSVTATLYLPTINCVAHPCPAFRAGMSVGRSSVRLTASVEAADRTGGLSWDGRRTLPAGRARCPARVSAPPHPSPVRARRGVGRGGSVRRAGGGAGGRRRA